MAMGRIPRVLGGTSLMGWRWSRPPPDGWMPTTGPAGAVGCRHL